MICLESTSCGYDGITSIIDIDQFNLEPSKLYFLVGKSGSGKSTFLEALGLMNNTFLPNSQKVMFKPNNSDSKSLIKLWRDEKELSEFRLENYAFIFQQTNMMQNMNLGENMSLPMLIEGKTANEAEQIVKEMMVNVNLDEALYDSRIENVSGGQRQRGAFVRAITSSFSLLLGDEPTGNLDKDNSHKAMECLTEILHKDSSVGLIVSHDIELATRFADKIFYIEWFEDKSIANKMGDSYCIHRSGDNWYDFEMKLIDSPESFLYNKIL